MGLLLTGGGVFVCLEGEHKGSGLHVGTPRCSSWTRAHATVCLSRDDIIAASCWAHTVSLSIVGTMTGFPAGGTHQPRYEAQANHYSAEWSNERRQHYIIYIQSVEKIKAFCFVNVCAHPTSLSVLSVLCLSCAAEKVSSLGKDWHKLCLKCDRCNKLLNAGGHAEVSKTPPVTVQHRARLIQTEKSVSMNSQRK